MDNIRYLPNPVTLTSEQKRHWQEQAAYWGVKQEESLRAVEYAGRHREDALRMLGMLGSELGLE